MQISCLVSHRCKMSRKRAHGILQLALLAVCAAPLQVASCQPLPDGDGFNQAGDTLQIAAREQELRRKEEELLNAMRNSESAPARGSTDSQPRPSAPAVRSNTEQAAASLEVAASASEEVVADSGSALIADKHEALKALEQHPALVDKKPKAKTPRTPHTATIKTHSAQSSGDGTTARRLGTYTRVKTEGRYDSDIDSKPRYTHTVALNDVSRAASIRSVSLSQHEVATIQSSSTRLRTGPSRLDTNVLSLPRYSEVAIDYRSGSWYRVKTPSGIRGWVPGEALLFDAGISERSAARIGAVRGKVR